LELKCTGKTSFWVRIWTSYPNFQQDNLLLLKGLWLHHLRYLCWEQCIKVSFFWNHKLIKLEYNLLLWKHQRLKPNKRLQKKNFAILSGWYKQSNIWFIQ
jgi:hypothetical protein